MSVSKKGFTLVELLVVIAIIAMLLSILMPSLNKVRNQAREQICKSSLRQFCIGIEIYAENNNNKYPGQSPEWVANGLDPTAAGYNNDNWAIRVLAMVSNDYSLFKCPAAMADSSGGKDTGWSKETEKYGLTYTYNGASTVFKRGKFDHTSEKILVQDLGWRTFTAWTRVPVSVSYWNDWYTDWPSPSYRNQYKDVATCLTALKYPETSTWNRHKHSKTLWGRNLGMMDGHVEWREWGVFLDSYLPSSELKRLNYIKPQIR